MGINAYQDHLIAIGTRYFENEVRPRIASLGGDLLERTLFCFSGSVAYGYCDELSDIEMELFVRSQTSPELSARLAEILSLHQEYESVRISPGVSPWKLDWVLDRELAKFWDTFDAYRLYEMTHAVPVWDPLRILAAVSQTIRFYPQELFVKSVRGLWITANDSGGYIADYSIRRNNETGGYLFLYRGLEALLRLIYLLNRCYYPHSKWLCAGLGGLDNDFGAGVALARINSGSLPERYAAFMELLAKVREHLLEHAELMRAEEAREPWALLNQPYYIYWTF